MDNTSWPEAIIASTAILSAALFLCVIAWQITRVILAGMTMKDDQPQPKSIDSRVDA